MFVCIFFRRGRKDFHPRTPDIKMKSRVNFDNHVRTWRIRLHDFSPRQNERAKFHEKYNNGKYFNALADEANKLLE